MTAQVWGKLAVAFALAAVAAVVVPRVGTGDAQPDVATLVAAGAVIALLTTGALYVVLRTDLGLPTSIALLAMGYNALVVLVKFVLAPRGLYEVSEAGQLEAYIDPSDTFNAILIATLVFALYALALWLIYRICRRTLARAERLERERRTSWKRVVVTSLVAAAIVFASGGLPLVAAFGGAEYIGYVLSSGVSALVAVALGGAIYLATMTLRSSAEQAAVVGDAALLVSVFWLGLGFLALYHALWVVYVLVLTSIWPLKVITPK
jgi:hypothetical protein